MTKTRRKKLWKTYYKKHKKRIKAKHKIWREKNRNRLRAQYRKYYKKHRKRRCFEARLWYRKNTKRVSARHIKCRYGLGTDEFLAIRKKQKNRCAICQNLFLKTPFVDHDHKTEAIRGLLCPQCNTGLGMFKDSIDILQRATKYLKP